MNAKAPSNPLDQRAQRLLKTLVERYIADGEPVGSRTLSRYSGLDLSAATVRNVMADLEELGFISSPHTSAGRIPTPMGYRFFVDTLLTVSPLEESQTRLLEDKLHPDDPQRLLAAASQMLSDLSRFAGIVAVPRRHGVCFRHMEFLSLSDRRVLLILVTTDGNVQNRILFTDRSYSAAELVEASNYFNSNFSGQTLDEVQQKMKTELEALRVDMTSLMRLAIETGAEALADGQDGYVLSGESNLLHVRDLSGDMSSVRRLFDVFEKKTQLLRLLDVSQQATGVHIFIGGESGVMPLDECSIVTASYETDGKVVGTVGVIGPTRMAYDRVIPIVDITAKLLTSALSQSC